MYQFVLALPLFVFGLLSYASLAAHIEKCDRKGGEAKFTQSFGFYIILCLVSSSLIVNLLQCQVK
jgi:hypothetical protein